MLLRLPTDVASFALLSVFPPNPILSWILRQYLCIFFCFFCKFYPPLVSFCFNFRPCIFLHRGKLRKPNLGICSVPEIANPRQDADHLLKLEVWMRRSSIMLLSFCVRSSIAIYMPRQARQRHHLLFICNRQYLTSLISEL